MKNIITPIIHLNGNSRESLISQLANAGTAVRHAIEVLQDAAPNGRNYYLEEGRLQKAEAQHRARIDALQAVYDSLQAEAIQIDEESA